MKYFGSFSKLAALGLALLVGLYGHPAQAVTNAGAQQGKAKVVKITGEADFKDAASQGKLKVGQTLGEGASITTGAASTVILNLGVNGQSLTIKPGSTVAIDTLNFTGTGADTVINTRLNLIKGGLNGNVKKLAANSKYEVQTARGVAGVRGTWFGALASGVVHCFQGSVWVIYVIDGVESEPVEVKEGETAYPPTQKGAAPLKDRNIPSGMEDVEQKYVPDSDERRKFPVYIYISPTTGVIIDIPPDYVLP